MASKGDHRLTRETLVKNIRAMRQPTQLLRVADNGRPKFKMFHISSDHKFLMWDSTNKRPEQTRIALNDITQVVYGQRTEKFNKARRKDLDSFSFSIIYRVPLVAPGGGPVSGQATDSLDLVCKDEKEFTIWAHTMLAISENKIDEEMWQQAELLQEKGSEPTHQKNNASVAITSVGNEHQETSDMYAFGWGEWGQIANAREVTTVSHPKLVESLLGKGTIAIACGWSHTTILLETGTVLQVGNRLGTGLSEDYFTPMATEIMERQNVVAISCGSFHTLAMTEKGEVLAWGCNVHGQLGLGHTRDQKKPTLLSAFREQSIKKLACGHYSSLALADDGTVFTWGCGEHGALGHNDTKDYHEPTAIQDLFGTDIIRVAAGGQHMFACTARETYAWGWNACGQLGLGHEEDQLRPHVVDTLRGNQAKAIACGAAHSIAVVHMPKIGNNVVFSWGSNCCGQLGQDKKTNISKPLAVPLFSGGAASGIEVVVFFFDPSFMAAVAENSTTICVGNLPDYMTHREFRLMFKFANGVERCVVNNTKKGHQVGYARFTTLQDAQNALEWLNGYPLDEEYPDSMKVFMSSTQLRDPLPGAKRPFADPFGGPAAKFAKGGGKGFGFGAPQMAYGAPGLGMPMAAMGFGGFPANGFGAPAFGGGKGFGAGMGGKGGKSPLSVYVGGIPHDWDEGALRSLFEGFGAITTVRINRGSNPVGNIGFVHYSTPAEAQAAIQNMNNYALDDTRHLVVRN